jgi:hypothetical protein
VIEKVRVAAQIGVVLALTAVVAAFADWPRYHQIGPQSAVIKLSFTHGSNREAECRRRTAEELARLPPNMRKPLDCPRARGSVYVELELDGRMLYAASLPPSGIAGDGPSRVYRRFLVPAGSHTLTVRMRDTPRREGFDYVTSRAIVLAPEDNLVVDFGTRASGFVLRGAMRIGE